MTYTPHHFGFTVSDLQASADFYAMFGAEEIAGGRFHGNSIDDALGVKDADLHVKLLRIGSVVIELLEYRHADRRPFAGRNDGVGAPHVAFQVDDIHAVYDALVAKGVEAYSKPYRLTQEGFEGGYFVYLRDPDGITVELLQSAPAAATEGPTP